MKRIKIIHDSSPQCPWTDWDCEPDLMFSGGRGNERDFSEGSIVSFIVNKAETNTIIRHQKALAEILEIDLQYFKDYSFTKDEKADDIRNEFYSANIEQLGKLCELFKIPYTQYNSTGYSQGDWADVLIVLTDEFYKRTGCSPKNAESILEGTAELFDQWAWGDVYGFRVEECKQFTKTYKDGTVEEDEEWEEIDSCWGFYGTDWMNNGMADYIDKELHEQLKNYDYNDIQY